MIYETNLNEQAKMEELSAKRRGQDVGFDRIRRITGYLVGTLDRFNTAKRSEVNDRVKHECVTISGCSCSLEDSVNIEDNRMAM